jgi:hypothetical protein
MIMVEGSGGWTDTEVIELPGPPQVGEPIETRYGTLVVAEVQAAPEGGLYAGKIVCRM